MNESAHKRTFESLYKALEQLKNNKPNDRSMEDRAYAICITKTEESIAYFDYWVNRNLLKTVGTSPEGSSQK